MAGKHDDRAALLKDANYFASELVTRLERLEEIWSCAYSRVGSGE